MPPSSLSRDEPTPQWKCRVLTTGPPRKSQSGHFSLETGFVLWSHWGPSFRRCLSGAQCHCSAKAQLDPLFAAPWTVPTRPSAYGIFQARMLKWAGHTLLQGSSHLYLTCLHFLPWQASLWLIEPPWEAMARYILFTLSLL